MLKSLSVENFAVTKSAHLDFAQGFCALTGETGAGKSMLVDALAAAIGARAEASCVRQGCQKATVSAVFEAAPEALAWMAERGIDAQGGEASLRRAIEAQGRSKAWINGVSVSVAELRELGSVLVAIHGQHESVALAEPKAQREHLDAYAKAEPERALAGSAHKEWIAAKDRAAKARAESDGMGKEKSQLAWEIDEIARAAPQEGEWERLEELHARLARASETQAVSSAAIAELVDDEASIASRLAKWSKSLSGLASPHASQAAQSLAQACDIVAEAARDLGRAAQGADLPQESLSEVEERLGAFHALGRKLRIAPADLWAKAVWAQKRLAELDGGLDLASLDQEQSKAFAVLEGACAALGSKRREAAGRLSKAVGSNLEKLGMGKASLSVVFEAKEPGPSGSDLVEFALSGFAGAKLLPLSKCASGGELARIGLALCAASLEQSQPGCLVFDEVDAGIGGPTAVKVGQMLSRLGSKGQALAVTHLPQVAALADRHYAVGKKDAPDGPESVVAEVSGSEREQEIARMLGDASALSARGHAKTLLKASRLL